MFGAGGRRRVGMVGVGRPGVGVGLEGVPLVHLTLPPELGLRLELGLGFWLELGYGSGSGWGWRMGLGWS